MQERRHPETLLLLILGLLLLGGGAFADEAPAEPPASEATVQMPFASGMKVVIDPETGKLRVPTARESQLLDALGNAALTYKSTKGLQSEVKADGTISLNLQGRFLKAAAATFGEDGRLHVEHDVVPVHAMALPFDEASEAWWNEGEEDER